MKYAERYRPTEPLSQLEERVLVALRFLPFGYVVRAPERVVYSVPGSDEVGSFRADFEVAGPEGGVLVVEAMTSTALTLMNLCVLAEIDRLLNQSGRALLVLVQGDGAGWVSKANLPQFAALRIQRFTKESEVVATIQNELALMTGAPQAGLQQREW